MDILLVSCVLPPRGTATAALIRNLCEHFSALGHTVDGITTKNSLYDAHITDLGAGVAYHANYVKAYRTRKKKSRDQIYAIYKRIRKILKPETRVLYNEMCVSALYKEMIRCHAERYDAIISVCAEFDSLEAVLRFKRNFRYKGKVALYQVDPLSDNPVLVSDGVDNLLSYEIDAVRAMDCVFTTPIIYRDKEDIWKHRCATALEFPALVPGLHPQVGLSDQEEVRCVFAGYLYDTLRNPKFTLEWFSRLSDPRIHLYIVGSGCEEILKQYEEGPMHGRLHLMGQMSIEECNSYLENADVLVNIGNSVSNMLPSKIINYIGYGKPILDIVKTPECPTLRYMEKYPLAYVIRETDCICDSDVDAFEKWINSASQKRICEKDILTIYTECTPKYVAQKIIQTLQNS